MNSSLDQVVAKNRQGASESLFLNQKRFNGRTNIKGHHVSNSNIPATPMLATGYPILKPKAVLTT